VRVAPTGEEERASSGSFDVLQGLVIAVDTKDRYTKRHSEDVARYAVFLAERLGLDEETRRTLHLAGLLHDVGKIGIPDAILLKLGKLTVEEFELVKTHTTIGARILSGSRFPLLRLAEEIAFSHHERWDGNGYAGLKKDTIPLAGRIVAVADVFDALTSVRPYKPAWPAGEAYEYLDSQRGRHFDPRLVEAFIGLKKEVAEIQARWQDPAKS
jgi:putative two-component system response regulator